MTVTGPSPTSPSRGVTRTIKISDISLRERQSGLAAGGTQVGKSTLCDLVALDFMWRYRARKPRRLISDTKPRYRAQWRANGTQAARLYKYWDHGEYLPDSVLATSPEEMLDAFKQGHSTVIVSTQRWQDVQDQCIAAFHNASKRGRPQLLQVDETCDHFYGNGMPRGTGALIDVARAGAERGGSGLYATQRTHGISGHLLEHMRKLWAFRLDNKKDAKRFQEFGAPEFDLPTEEEVFRYWTKDAYHKVWGPYRLTL